MNDKELKRLSRIELLELLWAQTKENEILTAKLAELEAAIADRRIRISEAGTLAQASVELNGLLSSAQATAKQYLENIAAMEAETRERCRQMLAEAWEEAERIRTGASAEFAAEAPVVQEMPLQESSAAPRQEARSSELEEDIFSMEEIYKLLDTID